MKKLPEDFVKQAKELFGNSYEAYTNAINSEVVNSIRINDKLTLNLDFEKVKWCDTGYYLSERPYFTLDPFLHAGAYYVQEASSMFLEQFLKKYVSADAVALDMCAAPGGKSSLMSQYLLNGGLLISNDIVRNRAAVLTENSIKWGNDNCLITNNAPSAFEQYEGFFDAILVDAPCSGEGMFRKDDTAITEWSLQNVQLCAARQKEILKSAWVALKEGGVLIYSTCTYNAYENEDNVKWLLDSYDAEMLPVTIDAEWGVSETPFGYHFYPHKTKGEGLFMAAVRKLSATSEAKFKKISTQQNSGRKPSLECLQNLCDYQLLFHRNLWYALPKKHEFKIKQLLQNLNVIYLGIEMYEQKRNDFIPQESLALSKYLNKEAVVSVDLSLEEALRYLRSETIAIDAPKGFCVVTYCGLPLGWVKNIGNRCNNLYPNNWRIRMEIPTDNLPQPFMLSEINSRD